MMCREAPPQDYRALPGAVADSSDGGMRSHTRGGVDERAMVASRSGDDGLSPRGSPHGYKVPARDMELLGDDGY